MSSKTIYTCDRCKKELKEYADREGLYIGYRQPVDEHFDVCRSCLSLFRKFMKGQ